jgi:hypothetical protein
VYCTLTFAGDDTIFPVKPPEAVPDMLVTVESGDVTVLWRVPVSVSAPLVNVTLLGLKTLPPLGEICVALVVRVQSTFSVKLPPPAVALTEPLVQLTEVKAGTAKFNVVLAVPVPC